MAIKNRHLNNVKELLVKKPNLESHNEEGMTPLCCAIAQYNPLFFKDLCFDTSKTVFSIIQLLLDNNADANAKTLNNKTPLILAIKKGYFHGEDLIVLLLSHGADVLQKNHKGKTVYERNIPLIMTHLIRALQKQPCHSIVENTLNHIVQHKTDLFYHLLIPNLFWSGRKDVFTAIQFLLKNKIPINQQDKNGDTPLHIAIREFITHPCDSRSSGPNWEFPIYLVKLIKLFVKNGANLNVKNNDRKKPIDLLQDRPCFTMIIFIMNNHKHEVQKKY